VNAQLQSSHGEDSSDEPSPHPHHHHHHHQQQQQPSPHPDREMMDTQAVSRPFSVLADRHAVLLRVATATLHTAAAANAAAPAPGDPDAGAAAAAAETICLVDRHRSDLPPITGADLSSSDDCPPSAAATASPTTTPSPRRACPSIAVHSTRAAPASADDEVFRAVGGGGATLTVDTCLADGRPSLSSSADGQTDLTRLSASDDSPQPDLRPSAASTSTIRPQIQRENGKCQRV